MTLYHFTAAHLADDVAREGLSRGVIPLSLVPPTFLRGFQWLTESKDWQQSWCARPRLIKYRRDDVRFRVEIPEGTGGLARWNDNHHLTPLADILSSQGDPQNWWIFRGRIPAAWLVERSARPAAGSTLERRAYAEGEE